MTRLTKIRAALAALILCALSLIGSESADAVQLRDRCRMTTATTGTGTITLGSAVSGYQSFAGCGITDGQVVRYCIDDPGATWPPTAYETGSGTYTSAGTTLSRTVSESSNSDSAIDLSGSAHVFICNLTVDLPSETTATEATVNRAADYAFILQGGVLERALLNVIAGDVVGPASVIDNQLARYDGTTGKLLQSSAGSLTDDGSFSFFGTGSGIAADRTGNNANGPNIRFNKNRHASDPTAFDVVQNNDELGYVEFRGADGDEFLRAAMIFVEVDGSPGNGDMPGRMSFWTTADGASSVTERFRISNFGGWGIAGANYGTSAQVFTSGGSSAAPSWSDPQMDRGHLFGLTLSNNGTDAVNDIDIAAGEARDRGDTENMTLAASITKRLDGGTFVVGTNQPCLNTGSEASSTWYEIHLIKRTDTGVVDVMCTTTANRATLPTNYTKQRQIGWIRNDSGSTILAFTQVDDHFTLTTQVNDAGATITATAAQVTLTVPPSSIARFRATAEITALTADNVTGIVFSEVAEGNVTPAITTGILSLALQEGDGTGTANDSGAAGHFELRANSSSQIEWDGIVGAGSAGEVFDISTFGWIDHRGRMSTQ